MTREEILDKAKECITGKRVTDYGKPENNFMHIAHLWNSYLADNLVDPISSRDVAVMMALMKIARIASGAATEDSFVDACGYMACGGELPGNG